MQQRCYSVIPSQKTGNELDLAMKPILVGALKGQYVLFESLDNGTAMIVFRNTLNHGRRLVTTSSLTYISMIPAISIER